ncbi:MAG: RNA polymerase factor sigma-54 [Prevotellaceae bacterium]|jgi:RNA polymerase sigma-54 factor|nr:RNA polymerase factor sigma-54 [Prevotellaceae bacterium]
MLKQELNIKLQQRLSPMQYQLIRMLEYSSTDMEEIINDVLQANPALDEDVAPSKEADYPDTENFGQENENTGNEKIIIEDSDIMEQDSYYPDMGHIFQKNTFYNPSSQSGEYAIAVEQTFREYLVEQLNSLDYDRKILKFGEYIIDNIDKNGYLTRNIENMIDDLAFQQGIKVDEATMEKALEVVQSLEPAGVAAKDARDCLLIQLHRKKITPNTMVAIKIIEDYLPELTARKYQSIEKKLKLTKTQFEKALNEIMQLNPKPGSGFSIHSEEVTAQVIPDFLVERDGGQFYIHLNDNHLPRLKVSETYKKLLENLSENHDTPDKEALEFTKQKLDSARIFIEAVKQRTYTLTNIMTAIVHTQEEFFKTGDEATIKPMKLKDIADIVHYDISSISRVNNSKYVQTEFGMFPLKFFFTESIEMESGNAVSSKKIQAVVKEIVDSESKKDPITDGRIQEILTEKGYMIARRTIAKYRNQLNIPSSRDRNTKDK